MSKPEWKHRVRHILEAIGKINRGLAGKDFEAFQDDPWSIDAVIRNLLVIGEATNRIPREVQTRHLEIPWADIIGMRNILVHDYDRSYQRIIWDTLKEDLPVLAMQMEELLKKES